jgi:hypothetical protein
MNLAGRTVNEIAGLVSEQLRAHGIRVVVVGGGAITAHVPTVYSSEDVDLAVLTGVNHRAIAAALAQIGFERAGRTYVNETTIYPIDIVADIPWVDQRAITVYQRVDTAFGSFDTLRLEDAVADRIAAFLYWDDSASLDVAERAIAAASDRPTWKVLHDTLLQLESGPGAIGKRFELALERLSAIYHSDDVEDLT